MLNGARFRRHQIALQMVALSALCYNAAVQIFPESTITVPLRVLHATAQPRGLRTSVLRTPAAIRAIEKEYRALFDRSSRASLYQRWEWLHQWWESFGGGCHRPCWMTFHRAERLIGCAPFVTRRPGLSPLRRLEPMGVLRSDTMDLVIEDGEEEAVLQSFYASLCASRDWDLLDIQQIPEDSPTLAFFQAKQQETGCIIRKQEVCPYTELPSTWEAFLQGLGKKNRYNVGYYRRLLERDFALWIGRVGPEDLESAMEELFRLHRLRWKQRHLPGAFYSEAIRGFHRSVAPALLETRTLDLYRLDLDGRTAAVLYCFAQNGRGYYYLGGFDPEYSRYSVGTVLTAYAIQQSIARGHSVFDFLRGDEPYKYRWNVKERFNFRVEWLRGGLRSRALFLLNEGTRVAEHQAKTLARKLEK